MTAPASRDTVLQMLHDGGKVKAVAQVCGWPFVAVAELAQANGLTIVPSGRAVLAPSSSEDLIERGKASPIARIQAAAARAERELSRLAEIIREEEERDAKARRIRELENELRALKAEKRKRDDAKHSARDIRAWAQITGLTVPATGPVPANVRQAYAEAHP